MPNGNKQTTININKEEDITQLLILVAVLSYMQNKHLPFSIHYFQNIRILENFSAVFRQQTP